MHGLGAGYRVATHAADKVELGHEVAGIDIDPGKIAKLSSGDIPFYGPGRAKMLQDNLSAGRLQFTTDYGAAADFADVHFPGVGTPRKVRKRRGSAHVNAVIDDLVPRLTRPGSSLAYNPIRRVWRRTGTACSGQRHCGRAQLPRRRALDRRGMERLRVGSPGSDVGSPSWTSQAR